ncbi:hypothetical protein [Thiomicrorhabdus sp.]|uniref:hypothetical protein n=1 Tax=Thiomicrorhabdus sp. TaxID=2039724 RepID=UPI0035621255
MLERIMKVLMFLAMTFAIAMLPLSIFLDQSHLLGNVAIGLGAIAIVSIIQYIIFGKLHPMYLFQKK